MRRPRAVAWLALVMGGAVGVGSAEALEEQFSDLSASVEVASVFSLSLNNPYLAFPEVDSGQSVVLGEGRSFNEMICRSNSGRAWYLKAQLVSLKNLERNYTLPASQLKWKVVETTGSAALTHGRFDFEPFSEQPMLIYTSQGDDNHGRAVVLRFQYSLSVPSDAPAGTYVGQLVFTMVESP